MIYGKIEDAWRYSNLGTGLDKVFAFMQAHARNGLAEGRYDICGKAVFANVMHAQTKPPEQMLLENHRKYVDIHMVLSGQEHVWADWAEGATQVEAYNSETDIEFYTKDFSQMSPLLLVPGRFLLLWPGEIHAPCMAVEQPLSVCRLVIKVLAEN